MSSHRGVIPIWAYVIDGDSLRCAVDTLSDDIVTRTARPTSMNACKSSRCIQRLQ